MVEVSTPYSFDETEFLQSAPDAMVICGPGGSIEFVNAQTERLFGYSQAELLEMMVEELLPARFREGHVHHRTGYVADPNPRPMGSGLLLFGLTKEGREVPVEVSLSSIGAGSGSGSRGLFVAAIRDVSKRVQTEEALREAKAEAERATAIKSRFLAAASHDLRQPLQSLGLYLSALDRAVDTAPDTAREIAVKMQKSVARMGDLLDAMLDISQLDSGSVTPEMKSFPCQQVIAQIVSANAPQALEKGLEFDCTSNDCVVHSDPVLFSRVIENFVTNAIRYTDEGRVSIDCQVVDQQAHFSVSDTGVGIDEGSLEKVFEEYYQLDNPVRDRHKGLGLGLAIVKQIAQLLEHPLDVTSVPGEGSTFSVAVPLGQPDRVALPLPSESKVRAAADRAPVVLLVDDDPAIVDATTMLLQLSGVEVHTAVNGEDALEQIAAGISPDLLVSDYRLPGITGVELIQRVRLVTAVELPVVLMTGDTSASEIVKANLSNCTVMHKPVDSDQFLAVIDALSG